MPRRQPAPPPSQQPYHVLANVQPPTCSRQGISPWRVAAPRPDGTVFNTVRHVVVNDDVTVTDLIGRQLPVQGAAGTVAVLGLAAWQPGQPMPPVLVIEADCNRGKSHAVHTGMIRSLLLANPHLPMLHVSVRVTHAYDLHETVKKHYVTATGQPIPGVDVVLYKDGGDGGSMRRCLAARQLVVSPEHIAMGALGADLSRFHGGVLVLDEAVSFALSLGKDSGGTITHPQCVVDVLRTLATIMPHIVVMDRDMTLNPIGSALLACIAPERDVHHFQLTRPGQRNALCYTFDTLKHARRGRGMPLAKQRLMLQLDECRHSFQGTPDDDSRKGPPQWRRVLIAVGSKKIGEMQIVPLLEEMGFTPEQYLFYHGNSAEAMKKAVLNTTKEWRNVMVIVATTTIEVAINIELGGNLSVAAGPFGRQIEGTGVAGGRDQWQAAACYSYAVSRGLFAGIALDGMVLFTRDRLNHNFYGHPASATQLLSGKIPPPRAAEPLYRALRTHTSEYAP